MRKIFTGVIYLLFLAQTGICLAEEKTAEELCRLRNSASCELSGLKFFIDDDCPRGAKVLRPHGKEHCEAISAQASAVVIPQSGVVASQPATQTQQAREAILPAKEAEDDTAYSWWPLLLLAVTGLLFGSIYIKTGR